MKPHCVIDLSQVEEATRALLRALGEDPHRPGLRETPRRIAESWRDFFSIDESTIVPLPDVRASSNDLVLVRDIDFVSVCEHHLLPFSGVVHVAYEPRETIVGLSDLPRIVRRMSARLHLQESLTNSIADSVQDVTGARGVLVVVEARHGCVSDRGVRQANARAITITSRGSLDLPTHRDSALGLLISPDRAN